MIVTIRKILSYDILGNTPPQYSDIKFINLIDLEKSKTRKNRLKKLDNLFK